MHYRHVSSSAIRSSDRSFARTTRLLPGKTVFVYKMDVSISYFSIHSEPVSSPVSSRLQGRHHKTTIKARELKDGMVMHALSQSVTKVSKRQHSLAPLSSLNCLVTPYARSVLLLAHNHRTVTRQIPCTEMLAAIVCSLPYILVQNKSAMGNSSWFYPS